MLGSIAWCHSR